MSVEFFDDLIDTDMDNEVGKMANADDKGNYLNRLIDGCECFRMSFIEDARAELASLRSDLASSRQAMLDSIRSTAPLPGCGCAICKWLRGHPQEGETE